MEHLKEITRRQEERQPVPWEVTDAPEDYVALQIKGIVGIEFAITQLEGKWEVSQNRSEQDRTGVERGLLHEAGEDAVAVSRLVGAAAGSTS